MRVLLNSTTNSQGEPELAIQFIKGYESSGGTWTGTLTRINGQAFFEGLQYAINNDYELMCQPTEMTRAYVPYASYAYETYGIQAVLAAGANTPTYVNPYIEDSVVRAGAGIDGVNDSGYTPDFTDTHYNTASNISYLWQISPTQVRVIIDTSPSQDPRPLWLPLNGQLIKVSGVTGWENDINGKIPAAGFYLDEPTNPPDPPEYTYIWYEYNKFPLHFDLGAGAFQPGGVVETAYQSYSVPYIAGKLAWIKDQRTLLYGSCSWWEAKYAARVTATENNIRTQVNGYGVINTQAAISYTGLIPPDEMLQIGEVGSLHLDGLTQNGQTASLSWDEIPNTLGYELIDSSNNIFHVASIPPNTQLPTGVNYEFTPYKFKYDSNDFVRYRGFRNGVYTEWSEPLEIPYSKIKYKFIRIPNE